MKVIFSGLVLMLTFFSYAQLNQVDSKGKKQGDWVKYYPKSKHVEYKGKFIDDKPTGVFYYYEYDGTVKMVANHNHITSRSEVYFYHENKATKAFGIFRNMKKDSVWTMYSNTSVVSRRETFKNGVQEGMTFSYFVNNTKPNAVPKVCEEISYKNGKKDGIYKEYFASGVLKRECTYVADKLEGFYKTYAIGGSLESSSYFYNNTRHGIAISYTPEGQVKSYFIYGEKVKEDEFNAWLDKCAAKKVKTNLPVKK